MVMLLGLSVWHSVAETHPEKKRAPGSPGRALVVIGANDANSQQEQNVVMSWLHHCANNRQASETAGLKVLLVEPNPTVYVRLVENVKTLYKSVPSIVPVNMLIGAEGMGTEAQFYTINTTMLLHDCPHAPHWLLYQLSSLSRSSIDAGLHVFYRDPRKRRKCGPSTPYTNGSQYVVQQSVSVVTFAQLLHQNHLTPADVDVLVVDAQGYDAAILTQAFAASPFLFPRVVIFEHNQLRPDVKNSTIVMLESKGYATDCPVVEGRAMCMRAENVYAMHTRRGLYLGPNH